MNAVLAFLQANKVFYLATAKGYEPKVRPLGFVMEYDGKKWLSCHGLYGRDWSPSSHLLKLLKIISRE